MREIKVIKLCDYPAFSERAALWFSLKWGISVDDYRESIGLSLRQKNDIPQWYIVLEEGERIIAGAGVIDNDFHDRKDLSPNLCALFVEKTRRKQNIAKHILDFIRKDVTEMGYKELYLVTDHTEFYEKCGWEFLAMVRESSGSLTRMYIASPLT